MRKAVSLAKVRRKLKGREIEYWTLRWYDTDGSRRSQNIGKVGELSPQQRRKRRVDKECEVERYRGRCPSMAGYLDYYFKNLCHEHAPSTIEINQRGAELLRAFFGEGKQLDKFTSQDVSRFKTAIIAGKLAYVRKRKAEINQASANVYLRFARALFGKAVKEGLIRENPFSGCLFKVEDTKEWTYIDQGAFTKMQDHASLKIKALIGLCRLAGLRCSEALNLRVSDVNFNEKLIYITSRADFRTKSRKTRRIPMCPELADILTVAAREAVRNGQKLFITHLRRDNTQRDIQACCKRAGIAVYKQPTHALRKSCITDWAANHPIHIVQKWAGHADAKTTLKYYTQERPGDIEKVTEFSHWYAKSDEKRKNIAGAEKSVSRKPMHSKRLNESG